MATAGPVYPASVISADIPVGSLQATDGVADNFYVAPMMEGSPDPGMSIQSLSFGTTFSGVGAGDTISAIRIKVTAKQTDNLAAGYIKSVQLLRNGSVVGTAKTGDNSTRHLTNAYTTFTFGDLTSDLWGTTWTGTQVKTQLGVNVTLASEEIGFYDVEAWIDSVTAELLYTASASPPVVTSESASGQVGTAFSYQISATNTPTEYAAPDLPSGLSVNTGTGAITGTPTQSGSFSVSLSATNAGGTGTGTLTLTIAPAPSTSSLHPMMAMHSQHNTFAHQF